MSEFKSPVAVAPTAPDAVLYSPLSGLAIASLVIASLYTVVIVVLSGLALYFGDPLPLTMPTLVIPAASAVLALMARQQILRSEGTRSGMALANWGWWLSLLVGLGYAAVYIGTYLALTWQVRDFGQKFFDKLREGKVDHAFVDTLDPEQRQGTSPDNHRMMMIRYGVGGGSKKPPLVAFYQSELVRVVQQGGPDTTIRPLGINTWDYDKGYHFVQTYRVTTREGDFDAQMSLRSTESGKARAWRIVWSESDINASKAALTEYGEAMRRWRQDSMMFTQIWLQKRATLNLADVYMDTCDPATRFKEFTAYPACDLASQFAAGADLARGEGLGALCAGLALKRFPDLHLDAYYPGYAKFSNGGLVNAEKLDAPANLRNGIIEASKYLFRMPAIALGQSTLKVADGDTGIPEPFEPKTGRLRILHNLDFDGTIANADSPDNAKFHCDAQLVLESDSTEFKASRSPQWRVVGLNLISGGEPPPPDPRDGPGRGRPQRRMPQAVQLPNPGEKK